MAQSGVYSRYGMDRKAIGIDNSRETILTVKDVCEMLKCGTSHVYNMVNSGKIPAFRLGDRKGIRIKESDVKKVMEEQGY